MVKTFTKKGGGGGGSSKIRFVMLDAELKDGDITEITQAISNALRQVQPGHRQIAAPVPAEPEAGGNGAGAADEVEHEPGGDEVEEVETAPRTAKGRRRFPIPKAVPDLDLTSGEVGFEAFAKQKGLPEKDLQRYLLVAYWCKKYREIEAVTADHVYTCYRLMGWGTDIRDFAQPLRDLSRLGRGVFKAPSFTINQVGEAIVDKMNAK